MAKRWSKLKKQVEGILLEQLPLHIQCTEIRTTWKNEGSLVTVLGVFTVRLGKEEIWNFPRQFVDYRTRYPDGGNQFAYGVNDINDILRDYLDTPKHQILKKRFEHDHFGITNILKAADRRLGLKKVQDHFKDSDQPFVRTVLKAREALSTV